MMDVSGLTAVTLKPGDIALVHGSEQARLAQEIMLFIRKVYDAPDVGSGAFSNPGIQAQLKALTAIPPMPFDPNPSRYVASSPTTLAQPLPTILTEKANRAIALLAIWRNKNNPIRTKDFEKFSQRIDEDRKGHRTLYDLV